MSDLTNDQIAQALIHGWPDKRGWSQLGTGDGLDFLVWPAALGDKPTEGEIEAALAEAQLVERRAEVDAERDRRCEGPDAEMTFGGIVYQVRTKDMRNINGAATAAGLAVLAGKQAGDYRWHVTPAMEGTDQDKDFEWIAKDDSKVKMDAPTAYAFGMAAFARVSAHVFAGNAIKALLGTENEPKDITKDDLWP